MARSLLLLLAASAVLGEAPAMAKSNSYWDCYYREFELCQGRSRDPDAPAEGGDNPKAYCEGSARKNCEEEDAAKIVKGDGHSANEKLLRAASQAGSGTSGATAPTVAPSDISVAPSGATSTAAPGFEPEGKAASGDTTVLGVDVTLPIGEVAERYQARHVKGCAAVADSYNRKLCVDSPAGTPVELEFYRGRLKQLRYESRGAPVKLRAAIALAETKTAGKAILSAVGRVCTARFALGGGTMALQGEVLTGEGAPCDPAGLDAADLARVEWRPALEALHAIETLEREDSRPAPASSAPKADDVEKTKAALPL